jgi:hypothetical protein
MEAVVLHRFPAAFLAENFGVTRRTFASALSFSMSPSASEAYTPEQQQVCCNDAFRLCGPEIPDFDRVTACMVARRGEL